MQLTIDIYACKDMSDERSGQPDRQHPFTLLRRRRMVSGTDTSGETHKPLYKVRLCHRLSLIVLGFKRTETFHRTFHMCFYSPQFRNLVSNCWRTRAGKSSGKVSKMVKSTMCIVEPLKLNVSEDIASCESLGARKCLRALCR